MIQPMIQQNIELIQWCYRFWEVGTGEQYSFIGTGRTVLRLQQSSCMVTWHVMPAQCAI